MALRPEECWSLERVPWWEPPYILHLGRSEVKLGRSHENNKVCRGYQISRHHAVFVRSGNSEDWRTVRWSLVDSKSGQGTFVNQSRLKPGDSLVLNADDLIGFGCGDASSSRHGGRESFVYRLRPPEAFMDLETAEDLDIPDSEASTPPRLDIFDPDPEPPSPEDDQPPPTSQPSTSTSGTALDISFQSSDSEEMPEPSLTTKVPKIKLTKTSKRNREDSSERKKKKHLKQLFGSDEEKEKESSETNPGQASDGLSSHYSPISTDDESSFMAIEEEIQPQAMDLTTSPKEQAIVTEPPGKAVQNDIIKELAEKIKRVNAKVQTSIPASDVSDHPMVKIENSIVNIKKEPGLVEVNVPMLGGYSAEPECITILDSDEESAENDFVADIVSSVEDPSNDDFVAIEVGDRDRDKEDGDSDDEVQIISASETALFAAITKKIKVEYDCDEQEMQVGLDNNPEESIDQACSAIQEDLEKIQEEKLIGDVMFEVGCRRVSVMEALEQAKLEFNCSKPTLEQIVQVLSGRDPDTDSEMEEEIYVPRKKLFSPRRRSSSSDSISDLLRDSGEEEFQEEEISPAEPQKNTKSSQSNPSDQNQPSTSIGSYKNDKLLVFDKSYKVPKKNKVQKEEERLKLFYGEKKSRPVPQRRSSDEAKAKVLRKQKLAEIARKRKVTQKVETRETNVPAGVMRSSNSKGLKLLQDMYKPSQPKPKKSVLKEIPGHLMRPAMKPRVDPDSSVPAGNLEVVASSSAEPTVTEDKIFKETEDGYRVPKKLSVSNIQYSEKSYIPVEKKKKALVSIIKTKVKHNKRNIRWRDEDGFNSLTSTKFIPKQNKGKRVTKKNNKDDSLKIKKVQQNSNVNKNQKLITTDDILRKCLTWNSSWLEEQKNQSEPPPVHQDWQLIPVTTTFSSWEEYRKIFLPLMLQELWSGVSRDYEERKSERSQLPVFLQEIYQDHGGQFLTARCMALISDQQARSDLLTEGCLVQLELSVEFVSCDGKRGRRVKPSFAFIFSHHRTRKDDKSIGELDAEKIKILQSLTKVNRGYVVYLTLRLKQNLFPGDSQILTDKPMKLKTLSRIKPELRKFTALLELPKCRLFESIISPDRELCEVRPAGSNLHAIPQGLHSLRSLNQLQREIIVSVSQACVLNPNMERICLVQGPPGTGKSSTIAGLILQILYTSMVNLNPRTMARILVVAPSNAAVDQLSMKLLALQAELPPHLRFEMVRLGLTNSINTQVKSVSYDAVVARHMEVQTRQSKASDSVERDLRSKQQAADHLLAEKVRAEQDGRNDLAAKLRRDYREKMTQIDRLSNEMKRPLSPKSMKSINRLAVEKTLSEADVILTTLSSSKFGPLEKYLIDGAGSSKAAGAMRPISVCIMDEASQCVEPEALMPLSYGFSKLVMVGDHEQLPATVTSRKAQELDYQQSLFSRMISCMESQPGPCPVLRLETQYRMAPEIADWPARYFYGGKLRNGAAPRETGLKPLQVISVVGDMRKDEGSSYNKVEERIAVAAVDAVRDLNRDLTIGVITFYARQKHNISQEVSKRKLPNVVVNTVDGYQGSERDVIIISCVRSGAGIGFLQDRQRLNVALTRARHCLIVIGDVENLRKASSMWREFVEFSEGKKVVTKMESQNKENDIRRKIVKLIKKT